MPSLGKKVLHAYLTPEEYDQVKAMADQEAVRALLKANADLGRLGGLFKMAITEGRIRDMQHAEFRQTLRRIEKSQAQVAANCRAVGAFFRRGRQ